MTTQIKTINTRKMTNDLYLGKCDTLDMPMLVRTRQWGQYSQGQLSVQYSELKRLLHHALVLGQAALIDYTYDGVVIGFQTIDIDGNRDGDYCDLSKI